MVGGHLIKTLLGLSELEKHNAGNESYTIEVPIHGKLH